MICPVAGTPATLLHPPCEVSSLPAQGRGNTWPRNKLSTQDSGVMTGASLLPWAGGRRQTNTNSWLSCPCCHPWLHLTWSAFYGSEISRIPVSALLQTQTNLFPPLGSCFFLCRGSGGVRCSYFHSTMPMAFKLRVSDLSSSQLHWEIRVITREETGAQGGKTQSYAAWMSKSAWEPGLRRVETRTVLLRTLGF